MGAPLSTATRLSSLTCDRMKLGGDHGAPSGTPPSLSGTKTTGAAPGHDAGERTEWADNNTKQDEEQQTNRHRNELRDELFHHELERGPLAHPAPPVSAAARCRRLPTVWHYWYNRHSLTDRPCRDALLLAQESDSDMLRAP
jgi:hypothetical protein